MQKDLSELECLRRENSYLRSTLKEVDRWGDAEAEGVLAYKEGILQTANPYDRKWDTTAWMRWAHGWSTEHYYQTMRSVVDASLEIVPHMLAQAGMTKEKTTVVERNLLSAVAAFMASERSRDLGPIDAEEDVADQTLLASGM